MLLRYCEGDRMYIFTRHFPKLNFDERVNVLESSSQRDMLEILKASSSPVLCLPIARVTVLVKAL